MRTNIELDDELMAEAGTYTNARSKRAIVEEALTTYVAIKRDERRRATYTERLKKVRLQTSRLKLQVDTRDLIRNDRDR